MSSFDLGTNTSVPLTAIAVDAAGNPVSYPTVFAVDDESIATVADAGDGTAVASRVDASSSGTVTVTATVTNPDGSTITGTMSLTLSAQSGGSPNAVQVEIVAGVPS